MDKDLIYKFEIAQEIYTNTLYQPSKRLKYPLPFYIRKSLGLLAWDTFAYQKRNFGSRDIGRTTKMLVEAVYFSQNRKVYLAGYNQKYTDILVNQAKEMCNKLSIPNNNLLPLPLEVVGINFKHSHVYFDHYNADYFSRVKERQLDYLTTHKPKNW